MARLLALHLLLLSGAAASVVMEPDASVVVTPRFWTKGKRAGDGDIVRCIFNFRAKPGALRRLERTLYDVSDPRSAGYGKFLSLAQVRERVGASDAAVETLTTFLAGFPSVQARVSDMGDKVHVAMPAPVAERMLETEFYHYYTSSSSSSPAAATQRLLRVARPYSLPAEVAAVVSLVDDILRFPSVRAAPSSPPTSTAGASAGLDPAWSSCGVTCTDKTTPDVLREAYGIQFPVQDVDPADPGAAVAEFQGEYWDAADLEHFGDACGVQVNVTTTIGGNNEQRCEVAGCGESLLDLEYLGALTFPLPLTTVYATEYSLQAWADQVASMDNATRPLVQSVSYGNDEVQQTSAAYMEAVNQQFMALGVLGVSVLFASGDQGVWGRTGKTTNGPYNPDVPSSSPYVTSVGGTNFKTTSVIGEETTWNCGGGGFSGEFAVPSFQESEVTYYLKQAGRENLLPDAAAFNASGRAYPDISALAGATNGYCVSTHVSPANHKLWCTAVWEQ